MPKLLNLTATAVALAMLAGCVETPGSARMPLAPAGNAPEEAGRTACLRDVRAATANPEAVVLRSSFSEAGTEVIVGVGPTQAPWRCIAYRDGTTADIMSLTDEGYL